MNFSGLAFFFVMMPIAVINIIVWPWYPAFIFGEAFRPVGIPLFILLIVGIALMLLKKKKIGRVILMGLALGAILFWGSMVLSEVYLPAEQVGYSIDRVASTGGFPWHTMEYPPSPMGGDYVPQEQWAGLRYNAIFWFVIAFVISAIGYKRITKLKRKHFLAITLFGLVFFLTGIAYMMLQFD